MIRAKKKISIRKLFWPIRRCSECLPKDLVTPMLLGPRYVNNSWSGPEIHSLDTLEMARSKLPNKKRHCLLKEDDDDLLSQI